MSTLANMNEKLHHRYRDKWFPNDVYSNVINKEMAG